MPLHKRTELHTLLDKIAEGNHKQLYLCFGERYLCRQSAEQIEQKFLETGNGAVHTIDGSAEDNNKILSRILSFSLLPGMQIYRVNDSNLFLSKNISSQIWEKALKAHQQNKPRSAVRHLLALLKTAGINGGGRSVFSDISSDQWPKLFGFGQPGDNLDWADTLLANSGVQSAPSPTNTADRFLSAIEQGLPVNNILLLTTENIDKRKKLYNQIKKYGEIVDCSVTPGSSRNAVREQKEVVQEMVRNTLAQFNKTMEPRALELLFERLGFYPVGVIMEVEKLALYVGEREKITVNDIELLVARTREDAIFQLTEALGKKNRAQSLAILNNLTRDGVHSLAVIASIRNYFRKLLIFRSMQLMDDPAWVRNMNSNSFQNQYLPVLKEKGVWSELLKGHPYALFMSFSKASEFSLSGLKKALTLVLEAEYRLKGAPIPHNIVLEELLLSLITAISIR
jgi:DNA polymerase-3 subunit delta